MTMRTNHLRPWSALLTCCMLALAGCGAEGNTGESAEGAEGEALVPIVMTNPNNLNFTPSLVAVHMGYYEDEGLEYELIDVGGTSGKIAALLGGDIQFADVTLNAPIAASLEGQCAPAVAPAMTEYGSNMVLSKEFIDRAGITADMTIEEKASRLTGARIATTGPGGGAHELWQYVIRELGGLDPDVDTTLTPIEGGGEGQVAAMKAGQIDGFASGAPAPNIVVEDGDADWFLVVTEGDLPAAQGILYSVLSTTQEFIDAEPATVQAVVNANARAIELINEDPDAAREAIYEGEYSAMDRDLFDSAWDTMSPGFPESIDITADSISRNFPFYGFDDIPEDEWSCFVDQTFAEEAG